MASASVSSMDILFTAYLFRMLDLRTYCTPRSLMCRSFDIFIPGSGDDDDDDDLVSHVRNFIYDDADVAAVEFRKTRLSIGADVACRQRRMMGLLGGSQGEIRYKYMSMKKFKESVSVGDI